jgi:hypothetical protein
MTALLKKKQNYKINNKIQTFQFPLFLDTFLKRPFFN